jgi:hypothetical protein
VAVLGAGAFGQVLLVRRGIDYYALKVLSKQHLLQTGLQVLPWYLYSVLCMSGTAATPCQNHVCSCLSPELLAGPRFDAEKQQDDGSVHSCMSTALRVLVRRSMSSRSGG